MLLRNNGSPGDRCKNAQWHRIAPVDILARGFAGQVG